MWATKAVVRVAAVLTAVYIWQLLKPRTRWRLVRLQDIILRNDQGMEVHIVPLGAIIRRILMPDRQGNVQDVVLGFDSLLPYEVSEITSCLHCTETSYARVEFVRTSQMPCLSRSGLYDVRNDQV